MTLIDSFQNMSIRKGDTFHPNASEGSSDFWDPLASRAGTTLPPRSTTCPKSLEDLLLGAGERRTAELLRKVDRAVKDQSKEALSNVLAEGEVLPVPTFAVNDTDVGLRKTRTHSHGSDSGIGSSIASLDAKTLTGEFLHIPYIHFLRLTLTLHTYRHQRRVTCPHLRCNTTEGTQQVRL